MNVLTHDPLMFPGVHGPRVILICRIYTVPA
jgi:hypothetical protein